MLLITEMGAGLPTGWCPVPEQSYCSQVLCKRWDLGLGSAYKHINEDILKHINRALSKCLLNTDSPGAPTTSLGSLCQCLTTLTVKKCFLTPSLNLPWCSFVPFPHVPDCFPSPGSCREQGGGPWTSSSPDWTTQVSPASVSPGSQQHLPGWYRQQACEDALLSCIQNMDNIVKHSWPRTGPSGTPLVTIPQPGVAPFTTKSHCQLILILPPRGVPCDWGWDQTRF